ncbi:hypothetical protein FB107DRAFT_279810 [Schizophyllum commune]
MWAVVFSIGQATVTIRCGGSSNTTTVGAGITKPLTLLSPGQITGTMVRNSPTIINYTPTDYAHVTTSATYNHNAWVGVDARRDSSSPARAQLAEAIDAGSAPFLKTIAAFKASWLQTFVLGVKTVISLGPARLGLHFVLTCKPSALRQHFQKRIDTVKIGWRPDRSGPARLIVGVDVGGGEMELKRAAMATEGVVRLARSGPARLLVGVDVGGGEMELKRAAMATEGVVRLARSGPARLLVGVDVGGGEMELKRAAMATEGVVWLARSHLCRDVARHVRIAYRVASSTCPRVAVGIASRRIAPAILGSALVAEIASALRRAALARSPASADSLPASLAAADRCAARPAERGKRPRSLGYGFRAEKPLRRRALRSALPPPAAYPQPAGSRRC